MDVAAVEKERERIKGILSAYAPKDVFNFDEQAVWLVSLPCITGLQ